jgi:tetratricopeptide (TPR) repeat protein
MNGRIAHVEALTRQGRLEDAREALAALEPDLQSDARALQQAGQLHTHANRHAEAAAAFARAVELEPGNPSYLYNLATARIALGEIDEAERLLDEVITRAPHDADAYYNRATLRRQTVERNHVAQIERALAAETLPASEVQLCYAAAKELEDLGEYARAFAYLKRGAGARRRMLSYRVEDDVRVMDEIARTFPGTPAASGHADRRPVFVLGLPRSGTTLAERILSAHPDVASLGESPAFAMSVVGLCGNAPPQELIRRSASLDFAALGRTYCGSALPRSQAKQRAVDKTPQNFLYLGLIARALPDAAIVHLARDPMDVCYAMYKTLFRMAYPFSYDLRDLGLYFVAYRRLMDHWRRALPGRFLDLAYEDIVRDQEEASRRLIAQAGIAWDNACLKFERNASPSLTASAAQVRQPVYASSIGLWRRYEEQLAPLARFFQSNGISFA